MAGGDDTDGNNTGYKNVAIGTSTLGGATRSSDGAAFTGYENVAIGYNAGTNVSTSYRSVMIGTGAGDAITTTPGVVLIGYGAGGAINHDDASS